MKKPIVRKLRCAVYTRKSTEEGLDLEFNSLDAQRESGEAYVVSQRAEGWVLVPDRYDDGGFTGANLERPALQRLLVDIEASKIDIVVVYKIDRLSRALMDFAKLVEVFDRREVRFVSVTQPFNTTHLDGAADAQRAAVLRTVRARGHRRAHPRQGRRIPPQGYVDGRLDAARLRRKGPEAGRE
jgi:DNA invertase Pin-like site-specific DNA recombinase